MRRLRRPRTWPPLAAALLALLALLALGPGHAAARAARRGSAADTEEAMVDFEEAGIAFDKAGDYDAAERSFRAQLAEAEGLHEAAVAHCNLGTMFMHAQRWGDAAHHFDMSLLHDPNYGLAVANANDLERFLLSEFGTSWRGEVEVASQGDDFAWVDSAEELWDAVMIKVEMLDLEVDYLHDSPDIRLIHGFLSPDEAAQLAGAHDTLLDVSESSTKWCFHPSRFKELDKAGVWHPEKMPKDKEYCVDSVAANTKLFSPHGGLAARVGTSLLLPPGISPAVDALERKLGVELGLPPANGWSNQLLSYEKKQGYNAHVDCMEEAGVRFKDDDPYPEFDRAVTTLIYLTNVTEGGGTYFPRLDVVVKPEAGALLIWNNLRPDDRCSMQTQHLARPVVKGRKIAFQKWYHYRAAPEDLVLEGAQDNVVCEPSDCRLYNFPKRVKAAMQEFDRAMSVRSTLSPWDAIRIMVNALSYQRSFLRAARQLGHEVVSVLESAPDTLYTVPLRAAELVRRSVVLLKELSDYFHTLEDGNGHSPRTHVPEIRSFIVDIELHCERLGIELDIDDGEGSEPDDAAAAGDANDNALQKWLKGLYPSASPVADPVVPVDKSEAESCDAAEEFEDYNFECMEECEEECGESDDLCYGDCYSACTAGLDCEERCEGTCGDEEECIEVCYSACLDIAECEDDCDEACGDDDFCYDECSERCPEEVEAATRGT